MQQREFAFSTIIATVMLLSVGCSANLNSKAPWVWERDANSDDWSEELDLETLKSKPALRLPSPLLILHPPKRLRGEAGGRPKSLAMSSLLFCGGRCKLLGSRVITDQDKTPFHDDQAITTDSIWLEMLEIPFGPAYAESSSAPQIKVAMESAWFSSILGATQPAILIYLRSLFALEIRSPKVSRSAQLEPLAEQQVRIFILNCTTMGTT